MKEHFVVKFAQTGPLVCHNRTMDCLVCRVGGGGIHCDALFISFCPGLLNNALVRPNKRQRQQKKDYKRLDLKLDVFKSPNERKLE